MSWSINFASELDLSSQHSVRTKTKRTNHDSEVRYCILVNNLKVHKSNDSMEQTHSRTNRTIDFLSDQTLTLDKVITATCYKTNQNSNKIKRIATIITNNSTKSAQNKYAQYVQSQCVILKSQNQQL